MAFKEGDEVTIDNLDNLRDHLGIVEEMQIWYDSGITCIVKRINEYGIYIRPMGCRVSFGFNPSNLRSTNDNIREDSDEWI